MLIYIRPVKCNKKIINGSKAPAKRFGLVIINVPKKNIIILIWKSYYIPQNPQNTSQNTLKHYNQLRISRTEALRWLQTTIYAGKKLKVETEVKERNQKLLDFIAIEIIKADQQKYPEQGVINLPMDHIINISFNKHPMS